MFSHFYPSEGAAVYRHNNVSLSHNSTCYIISVKVLVLFSDWTKAYHVLVRKTLHLLHCPSNEAIQIATVKMY